MAGAKLFKQLAACGDPTISVDKLLDFTTRRAIILLKSGLVINLKFN
jgi:hypothetical protein